jgi:2-polyprenyl-3-methyl-5-hydroxy-6-metoxy-1,4-benzoquinol methylase
LKKYIFGNVVEVGAGMGGTTSYLQNNNVQSWVCLEPDIKLCALIKNKITDQKINNTTIVINDTLKSINKKKETIIYIDVIEHIENDKQELDQAYSLLNDNCTILIIVPAFNYLYNDFDKAIGHYRRYTKKSINLIIPDNAKVEKIIYLDSLGFFTSLLNKFFLA